jgi:hypothetical protein
MSIALTNGNGPHIGDPCPREACDGVLHVESTRVDEEAGVRYRYLRCRTCRCKPTIHVQIVPLHYAPRQKGRK